MFFPEISVVIPVYNAEKYLKKCIVSVINQTFGNFELILVNDGSIDKSGEICKEYSLTDTRIIVIDKLNGGVSSARNLGIDSAKGHYILFVDSDDYIEPDMLEILHRLAKDNNADLSICGINRITKSSAVEVVIKHFMKDKVYNHNTLLEAVNKDFKFMGLMYLWNKLLLLEKIRTNNIKFDENISWGEDYLFVMSYLKYCNSIVTTKYILYNYNKYITSSITNSFVKDAYKFRYELLNRIRDIYLANGYSETALHNFEYIYIKVLFDSTRHDFLYKHKNNFKIRMNNLKKIVYNEFIRKSIYIVKPIDFTDRILFTLLKYKQSMLLYCLISIFMVVKFKDKE